MMCLIAASVKEKQLVVTAPTSEDFSEGKKRHFDFFNTFTLSGGAQKKRKKEKEKEEAIKEETTVEEMERVKLGPSKLWTGLVLHHKDIFVSHVISKLNRTDRCFFAEVNRESRGVLEYAGVDVSKLRVTIDECSSISTLEWRGITMLGREI